MESRSTNGTMNILLTQPLSFCVFVAALAAIPPYAHAQQLRPMRIIVGTAAGGSIDTISRGVAQRLGERLGQNIVVDNRPGAGSLPALETLAAAAPDGNTMMMLSATTVIHPLLYPSRFNMARDVTPVSVVSAQGYVLVIHPKIPAKSLKEFVAHLRANANTLNYASSGIGSPIHMAGELFQLATGTRMTHIPFKGMSPAIADLVGGNVEVSCLTTITSVPLVEAGRLRMLAVTTAKRVAALPEIPTFAEAGVPGVVVVNWYGLAAPLHTPQAAVDRIAREIASIMKTRALTARLAADGSEAVGSTSAEFAALIRAEQSQWAKVIKLAGIRGQ